MKIDIHIHTKKTKRGDAHTREITPKKFCEIITNSDVGICAITNHNHFDIDQFNEIVALKAKHLQIWPGVELDISHESKRGHLIVISNPKQVDTFNEILLKLLNNESPDKFIIDISKIASVFKDIDVIYIAHYYNKKPNIEDAAIEVLLSEIKNPNRVIKEATDSISAGIFVSHGHNSIYGSDVQDWDSYLKISNGLPELRLPVESFEQFCLLLDKNESTIQTLLASKNKSQIKLSPFKGESPIEIDIWDDVNILFGSKGTGKTEILKSICKFYNDKGIKANLFESNVENLGKKYDLSGSKINLDISESDIYDCKEEILLIRNAEEADIASLTSYREHYSRQALSKIASRLIIREILPIDENQLLSNLSDTTSLKKEFDKFINVLNQNDSNKTILGEALLEELNQILIKAQNHLSEKKYDAFKIYKSTTLINFTIKCFSSEVAKKTGVPKKPQSTGFLEYASNRIKLDLALQKIVLNLKKPINKWTEFVWDFENKGKLFCVTHFKFQNGHISDGELKHLSSNTKNPEKDFSKCINDLAEKVYRSDFFETLSELLAIDDSEKITSIKDLVLFKRYFELNHAEYKPSNGESSMILLAKELKEDKDVYLVDEPEKSLGNDFISDFIVPILKDLAKSGKRIVIATHDANIAVRTLPYNSIYREHSPEGYKTYQGNPFSNRLKMLNGNESLDWKEKSMNTLEGGRNAFGERKGIYGNY